MNDPTSINELCNLFSELGKLTGKYLSERLKHLEVGADDVYEVLTVFRDSLVNELYPHLANIDFTVEKKDDSV
jgi:hypothetical protein